MGSPTSVVDAFGSSTSTLYYILYYYCSIAPSVAT